MRALERKLLRDLRLMWSQAITIALVVGSGIGGFITTFFSWHWIFLINIPIGIIALVYAWLALKNDETGERPTIDWLGLVMLSPGLALFLWGVAGAGEKQTFATPRVLVPALIGLALIIGFIYHALTTKKRPLLDLKLFRNKTLAIAVTTSVIFAMAFFGAGLLYPQYFIGVRGETTLAAGDTIDKRNVRRVVRALEVMEITGQRWSDLQRRQPLPYKTQLHYVNVPRDELYARADARLGASSVSCSHAPRRR